MKLFFKSLLRYLITGVFIIFVLAVGGSTLLTTLMNAMFGEAQALKGVFLILLLYVIFLLPVWLGIKNNAGAKRAFLKSIEGEAYVPAQDLGAIFRSPEYRADIAAFAVIMGLYYILPAIGSGIAAVAIYAAVLLVVVAVTGGYHPFRLALVPEPLGSRAAA